MAGEIKNLPERRVVRVDRPGERPGDRLVRHDVAIKLLEEQQEDQVRVNQQLFEAQDRYANELRLFREEYKSDKRVWKLGMLSVRVVGRWAIYIAMAAGGWAWTHQDKVEALFHTDVEHK